MTRWLIEKSKNLKARVHTYLFGGLVGIVCLGKWIIICVYAFVFPRCLETAFRNEPLEEKCFENNSFVFILFGGNIGSTSIWQGKG
jgi:hypothetical protein